MPLKPYVPGHPAHDGHTRTSDLEAAPARLASSNPAERRQAAALLAASADAAPLLAAALGVETERSVQAALLAALSGCDTPDAHAALAGCLRSEDAWLRNAAIDVLRGAPAQVAAMIGALLGDEDRDVRILATSILDTLVHPDVECWLLELIAREQDVNVCGAALDVLASVATEQARAPLESLIERFAGQPFIGFAARVALARIGSAPVLECHD